MTTLLIVGAGDVGTRAAEVLIRSGTIRRIVLTNTDIQKALRNANALKYSADAESIPVDIDAAALDLSQVDSVSTYLHRLRPSIILNTSILRPWWIGNKLSENRRHLFFSAQFAGWLPVALVLPYLLMKAVTDAVPGTPVVNASFPDAINSILARRNMAPLIGLGNIDFLHWKCCYAASELLHVDVHRVAVNLVAHHYHVSSIARGEISTVKPLIQIAIDGLPVELQEVDELRLYSLAGNSYVTPLGSEINRLAAVSGAKIISACLSENPQIIHAPGPEGLPGGYPVHIGRGGAVLALPTSINRDEAIRINKEGQVLGGIKSVENDGTVIFTDDTVEKMRGAIGFDCRILRLEDAQDYARELLQRLDSFVNTKGDL